MTVYRQSSGLAQYGYQLNDVFLLFRRNNVENHFIGSIEEYLTNTNHPMKKTFLKLREAISSHLSTGF